MKSLRLPRETHRFRPSSNPPRLPTFLQPSRTPAPATYFATCRNPCACHAKRTFNLQNIPSTWCFNDFDFRIALARRRGANFAKLNFEKCSEHASFLRFWLPNRSRAQVWCNFWEAQLPKVLRACEFLTILTSESLSRAGVVQILSTSWAADPPQLPFFGPTFASLRSDKTMEKTQHFAQFLPAKISHVSHLCCKTFQLQDLPATFSIVGS